jgi:hypothetical protein
MSGLDGDQPVLFVTVTAPGRSVLSNRAAILSWNEGISPRWTALVRELRVRHPEADVQFARVRELQERGAEHVHALVRGLPFLPHPELMAVATTVGFGRVAWIRAVDDRAGAASYLGTYLAKSRQSFPKGARVFAVSRRWRRGWQPRTPEPGRYLSGPPAGFSFAEWAGVVEGADVRRVVRRRHEDQDESREEDER